MGFFNLGKKKEDDISGGGKNAGKKGAAGGKRAEGVPPMTYDEEEVRNMRSPSPAHKDVDFLLCYERVKIYHNLLKEFDTRIVQTTAAFRQLTVCLDASSNSYYKVAQSIHNTNRATTGGVVEASGGASAIRRGDLLLSAAELYYDSTHQLMDGDGFRSYNEQVHKEVLNKLHETIAKAKKSIDAGASVVKAQDAFIAAKKTVSKKEKKYEAKGKSISESKKYTSQVNDMKAKEDKFRAALAFFDKGYEDLIYNDVKQTGKVMDTFINRNTGYLVDMLPVLLCIAPDGPALRQRLEERRCRSLQALGISTAEPSAAKSAVAAPAASGDDQVVNFTSFFRRGPAAEEGNETYQESSGTAMNRVGSTGYSSPSPGTRTNTATDANRNRLSGEPEPFPPASRSAGNRNNTIRRDPYESVKGSHEPIDTANNTMVRDNKRSKTHETNLTVSASTNAGTQPIGDDNMSVEDIFISQPTTEVNTHHAAAAEKAKSNSPSQGEGGKSDAGNTSGVQYDSVRKPKTYSVSPNRNNNNNNANSSQASRPTVPSAPPVESDDDDD